MALQDDIMGLLSSIGEAGDRATARGRRGEELYANIGTILGDNPNYRKALRELTGIGSRPDMTLEEEMSLDPILGGKVADIIEKYMVDAATPPAATEPSLPDTAAARPRPKPDAPIIVEPLPPIEPLPGAGPGEAGMLMVDDTGAAMQGQGMDEMREKLMSAPNIQRSLDRLQEARARNITFDDDISRRDLEAAETAYADDQERAIRDMQFAARKEGVYGTQGARLRAAAGEETGLSGALLNARMGREATTEDEIASLITGGASALSALSALPPGSLANIAMRLGIGRFSPQQIARNPQLRLQIEQEVRLLLPKPTAGAPSSYVAPSAQVGAQARQAAQAAARTRQAAAARARAAARGERSSQDIPITPSPAQRLGSTRGSTSAFDDIINRQGAIGMAGGMSVRDNILRNYAMMNEGGSTTEEMGNYNENVVQQMRRLKREFGTDKAVDLMREMYPEYRIGNSGLIMGKPKRSNDDSFPVPNAPLELLRNYLRDK